MAFFAPGRMELIIIGLICLLFVGVAAVVVVVLLLNRRRAGGGGGNHYGRMRCPECAELIVAEAVKCRFCGAQLGGDRSDTSPSEPDEPAADAGN